VDDCSTDGTRKLVEKYRRKNPGIRYVKTEKNSGFDSGPKNLGVKKAQGEYLLFLDDDDWLRNDALKILSKYLVHSGADAVYGDYLTHDKESGKVAPGWSVDFNPNFLCQRNFMAQGAVLVKKSALKEVGGYDESIPRFKDWHLWLRLAKRGFRFLHVPIIIYELTIHKGSISEKYKIEYDEQGNYKPTYFDPVNCPIFAAKTILGKERPLKVAIFTLTKDRLDYTKQAVDSMRRLAGYDFDYFVIDQGSKDGTVEWLKEQRWIRKIVYNKENIGIAKGWNMAVDTIKSESFYDIIVKVDNDAEFLSPNWLKVMVELFRRQRKMVLSPSVEGLEDSPGGVLRQVSSGGSPYVIINDTILGNVPHLGGICFAAPASLYDDWRFEDVKGNKDYLLSQHARAIGYLLLYCEELRVWHIDGTLGQHKKYPDYFKEK
jgi:GT2 family glycosyltransferase